MVLFCESDAPPVPQGTVPVEVVVSDERITYAEWFRWVRRQGTGIGLLLNADIYLDEGLEHLATTFDRADTFLALTRYNPGHAGFHLNDYPHWTQDVWGVRGDAELPESLLYASSFPLGFPGCDNRIAYVMWSHGFRVRNPCYHVRSVHLQASTARAYHKTSDRLYGGVSYVHPSLAPDEEAELEFTLWTRSEQRPAGVLINQQAIERGVHQLRHGEAEVAQRFLDQQQFTGLSWVHEAVGSAHLQGDGSPFASEDTVFLPMTELLGDGVELRLKRPTQLEGLTIRLPRRASAGHQLALQAEGEGEAWLELCGDGALALKPGGERRFWQPAELKGTPWCKLRLKLTGAPAAAEPAWRPEEGAELVLFGEAGALAEAKSLNVIAEDPKPEANSSSTAEAGQAAQAAKPLRTIQFADSEYVELRNLALEHSETAGPDGDSRAAVITSADGDSAVRYAFNKYATTESGAYTASVMIKAGTQRRIVLRINDQTGNNDARQAFDLATGLVVGPAINSGSATGASSAIESVGDGWFRCSIAAAFVEPLSFLQAPSIWFEHYAPSTSVGMLYTGEASVLEGVCLPSPLPLQQSHVDGGNLSVSATGPAEPALAAATRAPSANAGSGQFSLINRSEFKAEGCELVQRFGSRFAVFSDGEALYFVDRFWPMVGKVPFQGSAQAALEQGEEALFAVGFLQPLQEWKPDQIASVKQHKNQLLFWQYPCRTEEDAHLVHSELSGPQREGEAYQVYVGLPWATFIDRGVNQQLSGNPYPEALLLAHAKRAEALAAVLSRWHKTLQVHSVCQHIFWREAASWIRAAGITDLWLSHKEKGLDEAQGMRLHSWSLYAVNDRDPERRQGLAFVPIEQRPVFASFSGAHMKHYLSDVRQRMAALAELEGYRVTIKDMWHFNKVVYNFQVFGDESKKDAIETDEVRSYNELLSHTRFSLCPVGAGPNTLRLWESLAVGAIPVVLSDRHELPELERLLPGEGLSWGQVIVLHPEAELEQLDERLQAIDAAERHRRQRLCRRLYEASVAMTCFGSSQREAEPIPLLQELFKPQQVQVPGETKAEFTGVARLVPARLAMCSEGPSSIVVHLDQTEQLLGFQLTGKGCSLEQVSFTLSRYREFNKFDELPLETEGKKGESAWLGLPSGERWWAMGLKLTAEWKPGAEARPPAHLQLAVWSQKDAFAREARRLDRAGILKAASDRNADRQDDTFDTKHINSGEILNRLPVVAWPEDVVPGNQLFPPVAEPITNLIGEPLEDGITMYVHLMNRNENVQKNLPNWLQQDFNELILLDWSSNDPVAEIPGVFGDPRVRVVRVDGQTKFIRTLAQNLASRMARHRRIFKCDSDVEFQGDFFAAHPLEPGEFWVGDWHQARDANERHLHGETYYFLRDFNRVNGYDERFLAYGQDDTNLKDRMVLSSLHKSVFNYDLMHHQEHDQSARCDNQNIVHPMVKTYQNRIASLRQRFWSSTEPSATATVAITSSSLCICLIRKMPATDDSSSDAEMEALRIVAGWYDTSSRLDSMNKQELIALVWEKYNV
ncbi:glycosyltransferase family 47 protein [Synechococcus sp. CS-1333]|uniref:glycosyltransferase family 47 protein n=1 Tax=Synechococcus sp. CS-1333 TaxID=2848638 RepID=UPI00223C3394|nr:glycosyltransferase family 47 protein [Synechococcus sp. CS-1333]MCT0209778.1 glycosyltransferase family 47 protein [Synechococcus sp. CS-1333]